MDDQKLITLEKFCTVYEVEQNFVKSLHEFGLIKIVRREEERYILEEQLRELEKLIRLHYDLNINLEGIDAINHLLRRNEELNRELIRLKNSLKKFQDR